MENRKYFQILAGTMMILLFMSVFCLHAADKEIKVGVIFDYTGPYAAGGSEPGAVGTKIAIDMINEQGGVEGHKINAIYADAQSKVEVAINEAERLLNQENVDLLMGLFSSGQCVPLAAKVELRKNSCGPISVCLRPCSKGVT